MSRIQELIDRAEAGEPITSEFLERVRTLQALDLVRSGEVFVEECIERERQADG